MKKQVLILGGALLLTAVSSQMKAQAPTFQIIHNCADAAAVNVKIWANNGVLVNNLAFRNATPTGSVAAGVYTIGVSAPSATSQTQSLAQFTVTFATGVDYKIVANGIVSPTGYSPNSTVVPFTLSTFTSNSAGPMAGQTQVLVNHGSTDAPTVDVVAPFTGAIPVIPNVLVNNASYPGFAGWLTLATSDYKLQVRDQFSENVVQEYSAPLQTLGLGGARISVIASGFLNPANNSNGASFGLWVATATGGSLITLPTSNTSSTRLQAIHNSADAAASQVDVWLQSAATGPTPIVLINDFAFRTASPFIDVPTGQVVTLYIAPPTSTSVASAIATFTYNLASTAKYQLIASGIVSASGYTPGASTAGFNLIANASVRERSINAINTDVLVFHGSTDAPAVNVVADGAGTIVSNIAYGNYNSAGYLQLPSNTSAGNYVLHVTNTAGTATVASYLAPLNTLALSGNAITVLASGFLSPASNSNGAAFGLWVALASGGALIPLPPASIPTSFNTIQNIGESIAVYPNPFSSQIVVKNNKNLNVDVVVLDVTGKTVLRQNSTAGLIELITNDLQTGLYFVKVTSEGNSTTYKIVK